jgi:hypothetical protein
MAGIVNCTRCGDLTEQEIFAGKLTKNCKACRTKHTNKREPILKLESQPANGFYKAEVFNMCDNKETQDEEENDEQTQQTEHDEQNNKTIKQILIDINNNIKNHIETQHLNQMETKTILSMLSEQVANNGGNVETDNIKNTNNNEFIKKQQIQNKIIINKLENIINALT